jgi:hypothetical protein
MGLIYADIDLINPKEPGLRPSRARALFDSGAITLCTRTWSSIRAFSR